MAVLEVQSACSKKQTLQVAERFGIRNCVPESYPQTKLIKLTSVSLVYRVISALRSRMLEMSEVEEASICLLDQKTERQHKLYKVDKGQLARSKRNRDKRSKSKSGKR
ncbi:hypothetical protein L596_027349 [Steinernema carpocapsae]|uniref:Uncharacterized protein n=1 Tax=Steinernema carpocapsae TaxID=34508 RepID=A0A4U5M5F4_STECR|nr:hypothetical protein L596_027349 [Steinernema carpocapsae]